LGGELVWKAWTLGVLVHAAWRFERCRLDRQTLGLALDRPDIVPAGAEVLARQDIVPVTASR
jgi:hypothetical protein